MSESLPPPPVPADADRDEHTIHKPVEMPGFTGFLVYPFGVCAKEIGEPGGATNASPGSNRDEPCRRLEWL